MKSPCRLARATQRKYASIPPEAGGAAVDLSPEVDRVESIVQETERKREGRLAADAVFRQAGGSESGGGDVRPRADEDGLERKPEPH